MAENKRTVVNGAQLLNAYRAEEAKLNSIEAELQKLQDLIVEANIAGEAVEEIGKADKSEKIIISLGAGVYTEAMLAGNDKFKTGLAGSIMQNSNSKKTLDYLKEQREMLQKEINALVQEHQKTRNAIGEISGLLQAAEKQAMQKMQATEKQSK